MPQFAVALMLALVSFLAPREAVSSSVEYTRHLEFAGEHGPVHVSWLANAGFRIDSVQWSVVLDGLYDGTEQDGFRYTNLPSNELADARNGTNAWAAVDIVLATHGHFDHFDSQLVGDFLDSNESANFVGPRQAADQIASEFPRWGAISERVVGFHPSEDGVGELKREQLRIRFLHLPHSGRHRDTIENVAILMEIDGVKIVHFGDAGADPADYEPLSLAEEGLDLALIPFWLLASPDADHLLNNLVAAKTTAAMHLMPERNARLEALAADWPGLVLFSKF